MESPSVGGGVAQSQGRIRRLESVNDEHSLCLAVEGGQLSTFSSLLRQGNPMTARAIGLMFESWAEQGSKFCEAWLREGGNLNGFYDGSTPLKLALDHETCMSWLLEHGAEPNAPPKLGHPVDLLTLAAESRPPSTVRLLVEHGARTRGTEALHAAAATSATNMGEGKYQSDPSRVEVLRILLDHGADANEMQVDPKAFRRPRTSWTGTPLHRAVKYGSLEAVQCLLAHGADVSAPSWSGATVMKTAQIYQREGMIDALQDHVDRTSGQDDVGESKTVSKDGDSSWEHVEKRD